MEIETISCIKPSKLILMKSPWSSIKVVYCLLFFIAIFISCTDVPISYSTTISNSKILGIWQDTDTTAIRIYKKADNIAYYRSLVYNSTKNKFEYKASQTEEKVYFGSISSQGKTDYFISCHENPEDYVTAKFRVSDTQLILNLVSWDYLRENAPGEGGVAQFGTTKNFRNFIVKHRSSPNFFGKSKIYTKRKSIEELMTPSKKLALAHGYDAEDFKVLRTTFSHSPYYDAASLEIYYSRWLVYVGDEEVMELTIDLMQKLPYSQIGDLYDVLCKGMNQATEDYLTGRKEFERYKKSDPDYAMKMMQIGKNSIIEIDVFGAYVEGIRKKIQEQE